MVGDAAFEREDGFCVTVMGDEMVVDIAEIGAVPLGEIDLEMAGNGPSRNFSPWKSSLSSSSSTIFEEFDRDSPCRASGSKTFAQSGRE